MADWFVARAGQQEGPFTDDALRDRIARGLTTADDAVWRQGLPQWTPARDVPEWAALFPAATRQPVGYSQPFHPAGPGVLSPRGIDMLRQTKPWVRLVGVMIIIVAVLMAGGGAIVLVAGLAGVASASPDTHGTAFVGVMVLVMSGVMIVSALLYLVPGVYLNRYASRIDDLLNRRRDDALERALEAQKSFWKFVGILLLVSFALWLAMFAMTMLSAAGAGLNAVTVTPAPSPTGP